MNQLIHLDSLGRTELVKYLASKSQYIIVSHDQASLDLTTNYTLAINQMVVTFEAGNFSSWQARPAKICRNYGKKTIKERQWSFNISKSADLTMV